MNPQYLKIEEVIDCVGHQTKNRCEWCQDCQKDYKNVECEFYEPMRTFYFRIVEDER